MTPPLAGGGGGSTIVTLAYPCISVYAPVKALKPDALTSREKTPTAVKFNFQLTVTDSPLFRSPIYTGLSPETRFASEGKVNDTRTSRRS